MAEFVSESIEPRGSIDRAPMGRGEPGLPEAFAWRDGLFRIEAVVQAWKASSPEGGGSGNVYLRRHYYRLRMEGGDIWTVYFLRQAPRSGRAERRWFLYSREGC